MEKQVLKNNLFWYLSESIPNPLNSYQIAVVKNYIEILIDSLPRGTIDGMKLNGKKIVTMQALKEQIKKEWL